MNRRVFVATVGGMFALAGCTGSGASDSPGSGSDTAGDDADRSGGDSTDNSDGDESSNGGDTPTDDGSTSPTITAREFTRTGDCSDAGTAAITFGDSGVSVEGCISGNNGCKEASLAAATCDAPENVLEIVVETVDRSTTATACTEVIVHRGYAAEIGFEGDLPESVVVVHENFEGRTEVASAER